MNKVERMRVKEREMVRQPIKEKKSNVQSGKCFLILCRSMSYYVTNKKGFLNACRNRFVLQCKLMKNLSAIKKVVLTQLSKTQQSTNINL